LYIVVADSLRVVVPLSIQVAGRSLDIENLTTILLIGVMCWLLLRQLWTDWLAKEELRAEFDAASAMQARLVPSAIDVPGFRSRALTIPPARSAVISSASCPLAMGPCCWWWVTSAVRDSGPP